MQTASPESEKGGWGWGRRGEAGEVQREVSGLEPGSIRETPSGASAWLIVHAADSMWCSCHLLRARSAKCNEYLLRSRKTTFLINLDKQQALTGMKLVTVAPFTSRKFTSLNLFDP